MSKRWRVGQKLGRTLYIGNTCIGMVDTPALAQRIVDAMNGEYNNVRNGALDEAIEVCDQVGTFKAEKFHVIWIEKCKKRIQDLKF